MEFDKLEDIIEFAIAKEQEAMDFYVDLAGKVNSPGVADELKKMAAMEEKHRDWLKTNSVSLLSNGASSKVTNLKIADFVVDAQPVAGMTWQDAINLAMHRETYAMNMYTSLGKLVSDPTEKQLFESLAAEESKHKLYFETIWDEEILLEN